MEKFLNGGFDIHIDWFVLKEAGYKIQALISTVLS